MRAMILALLLCSGAALAQTPAPGAAIENGKRLFIADGCSQCHGTVGQGGTGGVRLAPDPKPLIVMQLYVRNPGGQMPAYHRAVLSDADLADMHAYLATIRKPPAPLLETLR